MNLYQTVTDRIVKQLEAGVIPWRQTWTTGSPKSLTTGKEYRGLNLLVLGAAGFTSRYWVTYREALRLGGHVRRGERASPVVYWKWRTEEEIQELTRKKPGYVARCVPFGAAVFNLDQVEGVARPADDVPNPDARRLEIAEHLIEVMPDKPQFAHLQVCPQPAYIPLFDRINLPHLSHFTSAGAYYAVLFHELVHSTGHPKRLKRFGYYDGEGFEEYAFEELVAEFGAAFLCAFTGIGNPLSESLQASYIQGWSTALKKDPRLMARAASTAQIATDYIRGKLVIEETSSTSELEEEAEHHE